MLRRFSDALKTHLKRYVLVCIRVLQSTYDVHVLIEGVGSLLVVTLNSERVICTSIHLHVPGPLVLFSLNYLSDVIREP